MYRRMHCINGHLVKKERKKKCSEFQVLMSDTLHFANPDLNAYGEKSYHAHVWFKS